jgi:high-affinity Fe2+/Pb2+ permease
MFKLFLFSGYFSFLFISNAHAYIDPGTISIILQGIVGAVVAGAVTIKIYWYKIRSFFKKKEKDKQD